MTTDSAASSSVPTQPRPVLHPISLFDVIAHVESRRNTRAVRFEVATFDKLMGMLLSDVQEEILETIARVHQCSRATAMMIYSSSWGATQIMGFNLYGPVCKYRATVFDFSSDESMQRYHFALLVTSMRISFDVAQLASSLEERLTFARRYNGAESYAALIANALKELGVSYT